MSSIMRRRPLVDAEQQRREGPVSENEPPQTAPDTCPCQGTGTYTVNIPLADAIVSDRRLCLEHGLTPRARLLDTGTERVGELMEVTGTNPYRRAWLRPVNGGREWSTGVGNLRPAPIAG